MKFFSDELSLNAVMKNFQLGLRVVVEEWQWLFLTASYNYKKKKLEKKLAKADASKQESIQAKLYVLEFEHKEFRSKQVARRTA